MRCRILGGLSLLIGCFPGEARPADPFYQVGDTWKYDYFYESNWMAGTTVNTLRGWTRVEITSVAPAGDTLRYGYRTTDSAVSETGAPYFKEGEGVFGYARGNYLSLNGAGTQMDLEFFARPLEGMQVFTVRYGADTLEFHRSDLSYDTYEFLEGWGPVRWRSISSGGHTMVTWERNLLEHNGVSFNRSGILLLDSLHVGVKAWPTGKASAAGKGWRRIIRVFHGRAVDGRKRDRE